VDRDAVIEVEDGRTIGYADFGRPDDRPVVWCHGGPGCRSGPRYIASAAIEAGVRLIGIDRPGYGLSTPRPGRSIADWAHDALAVADHLGVDRFATIGLSTGGPYALAVAALAPERVLGVVACCAITDMRCRPARDTMSRPHALAVWEAPDREQAIAAAIASHGVDGTRIVASADGPTLGASDQAMLRQLWGQQWIAALPTMFAHGVEGYTDDRIADRDGWGSFDVARITCPVIVLHGTDDVIADPVHARHTASIVPGSQLRLVSGAGHFSIEDHLVETLTDVLAATV
jgi:pimeloyl-ACP methyl ester carboxylesterase